MRADDLIEASLLTEREIARREEAMSVAVTGNIGTEKPVADPRTAEAGLRLGPGTRPELLDEVSSPAVITADPAETQVPESSADYPMPDGAAASSARTGRASHHLRLDGITLDDRLQCRPLKPHVVQDYTAAMWRGETFPPVKVVGDGKDCYYLVDGHHRLAAVKNLTGIDRIEAEVVRGTFEDALWLAWGANRDHGFPRTRKAMRRALRAALQHPKWKKESDRAIGKHIGCSHHTVKAMREALAAGQLPTDGAAPLPPGGPTKNSILQACRLLATVPPELDFQFEAEELAELTAGYEGLGRLRAGAGCPSSPASRGGNDVELE
jgi:ParB-like nuclease domain